MEDILNGEKLAPNKKKISSNVFCNWSWAKGTTPIIFKISDIACSYVEFNFGFLSTSIKYIFCSAFKIKSKENN